MTVSYTFLIVQDSGGRRTKGKSRVFVSYSRHDYPFAVRLARELIARGIAAWMDDLALEPGQQWDMAIQEALRASPIYLVILSPDSVKSDNVRAELTYAVQTQKRILPVMYKDCEIPLQLLRIQYLDFRTDLDAAFERLIQALGGSERDLGVPFASESNRDFQDVARRHEQHEATLLEIGKLVGDRKDLILSTLDVARKLPRVDAAELAVSLMILVREGVLRRGFCAMGAGGQIGPLLFAETGDVQKMILRSAGALELANAELVPVFQLAN